MAQRREGQQPRSPAPGGLHDNGLDADAGLRPIAAGKIRFKSSVLAAFPARDGHGRSDVRTL
eukprot:353608-Chlamydomonas_euryale.AAC.4